MERYYIDCPDHHVDVRCTVDLSADTKEELLVAGIKHGTKVHGYEDTYEFREMIVNGMKERMPPT